MVMVFTLFSLVRDGDHFYKSVYAAIPLDPDHKAKIFKRMKGTIGAVMRGTLLTAVAQGTTARLTYWALGVRFSIFLGVASAALSLLPFGDLGGMDANVLSSFGHGLVAFDRSQGHLRVERCPVIASRALHGRAPLVRHLLVASVKPGSHLSHCPNFRSPLSLQRVLDYR